MEVVNALGRRKSAIARIFVSEGTGKITINKRDLAEYFPSSILQYVVKQPLNKLGVAEKYDIKVNLCGGGFTGQSQALRLAIARALVKINADVPDEENDTVKLTLLGKTGTEIASVDIPGGTGGGGNTYNVTAEVPLESGYYVLSSAIGAVDEKYRYKGRCITYEVSQGKWETKQFVGTSLSSWEQEASWEDFGGAGTMKSLTVNGEKKVPDSEGNVDLTIDKLEVDESLDADSTNPVQNKTVAAKFQEVEAGTVFGMSAEVSDDESSVRLALTNKSGAEIASVDIPAGSGGGGESSTTKIVLLAETDKKTVKEGGAVKLTYTYDHQVAGGDDKGSSTGQKATVTIQVKRGTTTTYSSSLKEVSKGTYTLDLTKYLLVGTSDIYVIAETTDPTTGKAQKKQAYVSVKSVTLSLSCGYNLAATIQNGGYGTYDSVSPTP